MKVEFNSSKGKFAFIKCPDNTHDNDYTWSTEEDIAFVLDEEKNENSIVDIHVGNCNVIDFVKNLAEEQWSKVVNSRYYHSNRTGISNDLPYENYNDKTGYSDFKTAKDSGESLMDSLKVYTENPYWIDSSYKNCNESCLEIVCSCDLIEKWDNAEERTGNWLLIKYLNN